SDRQSCCGGSIQIQDSRWPPTSFPVPCGAPAMTGGLWNSNPSTRCWISTRSSPPKCRGWAGMNEDRPGSRGSFDSRAVVRLAQQYTGAGSQFGNAFFILTIDAMGHLARHCAVDQCHAATAKACAAKPCAVHAGQGTEQFIQHDQWGCAALVVVDRTGAR